MKTSSTPIEQLSAKLIACLLIVICIVVGAAGLILPIIPGLLFFAIATIIAAKHLPFLERRLRRNATFSRYLDSADGFLALSPAEKVQFGAWLCVKVLIDSVACLVSMLMRLGRLATRRYQYD